jgi:hypothetical protein
MTAKQKRPWGSLRDDVLALWKAGHRDIAAIAEGLRAEYCNVYNVLRRNGLISPASQGASEEHFGIAGTHLDGPAIGATREDIAARGDAQHGSDELLAVLRTFYPGGYENVTPPPAAVFRQPRPIDMSLMGCSAARAVEHA